MISISSPSLTNINIRNHFSSIYCNSGEKSITSNYGASSYHEHLAMVKGNKEDIQRGNIPRESSILDRTKPFEGQHVTSHYTGDGSIPSYYFMSSQSVLQPLPTKTRRKTEPDREDSHQSKFVNLFDNNRLHNYEVLTLQEEYIRRKCYEQGSEQITKKQAVNELDLNSRRSSVSKNYGLLGPSSLIPNTAFHHSEVLMTSFYTANKTELRYSSVEDQSSDSDNDYEDSTTEMLSTEVD